MLKDFFESMKNRMGIGDPERNATDAFERGMPIVPDSIKANEGEIPVRQYNIAILRTPLTMQRAEGRMQVTNKRLIFRAAGRAIGGRTTLQHEYAIDEVAGIEARREYNLSWLHFIGGFLLIIITGAIGLYVTAWDYGRVAFLGVILGLLFMFAGFVSFFMVPKEFLLKLAILGLGLGGMITLYFTTGNIFIIILTYITAIITLCDLFLFFMRPNLVISIKNKVAVGYGPVDIRRRTFRSEATGFSEVLPTEETEGAIREIGAIIGDIQKMGDFGLEKWIVR